MIKIKVIIALIFLFFSTNLLAKNVSFNDTDWRHVNAFFTGYDWHVTLRALNGKVSFMNEGGSSITDFDINDKNPRYRYRHIPEASKWVYAVTAIAQNTNKRCIFIVNNDGKVQTIGEGAQCKWSTDQAFIIIS